MKPSPTLAMTGMARKMKSEGIDVISFAAGEPDFNTPEAICDAAIKALRDGQTKYTPSSGTPQLKEAICAKLSRENGLSYTPDQIVASCGAKHSVYNSVMTLVDPGDEVLLIAPYWMTYADQIRLAGGVPVVVKTSAASGFSPTLEQLKEKISPKTKAIIINSPSNPTGAMLSRQTLKEIASLAVRHDFWIISDEIYERLVYGGEKHESIAALGEEVKERTIVINGCSKTYAMTGWRVGYCAAPVEIAKAMSNLQDQVTSNPTSFAQAGAVAALNLPESEVEKMRSEFEGRRNLIVGLLQKIEGLEVFNPQGAFYVMPNVSAYLRGSVKTDLELATLLLERAHVATVPGSVFEGEGHLRMSYAASRGDIERGVARIAEVLTSIV